MKRLDKLKVNYNLINLKVYFLKLNTSNFIIEEFIRGKNTIDYYDNNGDAVLLNVLHHLFSSEQIQWSVLFNKAIIEKYKIDLEYFLSKIGKSYI
jgi:hypothetical protein